MKKYLLRILKIQLDQNDATVARPRLLRRLGFRESIRNLEATAVATVQPRLHSLLPESDERRGKRNEIPICPELEEFRR